MFCISTETPNPTDTYIHNKLFRKMIFNKDDLLIRDFLDTFHWFPDLFLQPWTHSWTVKAQLCFINFNITIT